MKKQESLIYKNQKAEIFNLRFWVKECDTTLLKVYFEELLTESGFGILSFSEHFFPHQGYTAFWVLSESHLAIHTFPESNSTYIELSSCDGHRAEHFRSSLGQISGIELLGEIELVQSKPC